MIRNRKLLKVIAYFFLISILSEVFIPTLLYAQSTPTTPEFDTFMQAGAQGTGVNNLTGDFNYNIPLLSVPGPESSYPINLFYSSGIKPDQEASWAGLGWNVNVGSINRNVVGFPDDYSGVPYTVTDTWSGSADTSYNMAIPLGTNQVSTSLGTTTNPSLKYYTVPMDATSGTSLAYGALKGYDATNGTNVTATRTYDSYSQYDTDKSNMAANPDPERLLGGSSPAYDIYSVSGQGTGGRIEPVIFDNGSIFRKKVVFGTDTFKTFKIEKSFAISKPQFRFKEDFSNSFVTTPNNFTVSGTGATYNLGTGDAYTYTGPDPAVGYNTTTKKLAGSSNIEYYTNNEIVNGTAQTAGFIKYQGLSDGNRNVVNFTTQSSNVSNQIGGFAVTNGDGVTYHYALPVYNYSYTKTITTTNANGKTKRVIYLQQAYANNWLLTSVTGSDFIDRNSNGYADEGDTGGWTNFTYGSRGSQFIYREPYTGTIKEVDGSNSYATCRKQVYYLDAVYSRTHTAFFSKNNSRYDGMGSNDTINGGYGINSESTLLLDSILLYENVGLKTSIGASTIYSMISQVQALYTPAYMDDHAFVTLNSTYPASQKSKLKTIIFTYDYSLSPLSPNSVITGKGKLTLKQVGFQGKSGFQIMPPVSFTYEMPSTQSSNSSTIYNSNGTTAVMCICNNANIKIGDIVKFTDVSSNVYYATLLSTASPKPAGCTCNAFNMRFLGSSTYTGASLAGTLVTTKIPPYPSASGYDVWGNFKSDFITNSSIQNNSCQVTSVSALSLDVWSLRKITNPTGSTMDITYEPDSYSSVVYGQGRTVNLKDVIGYKKRSNGTTIYTDQLTNNAFPMGDATGDWYKVYFADPDTVGVLNYFTVNDSITLSSISYYQDSVRTIPFSDSTRYGTSKFKILTKGNDSRGDYLTIGYTGISGNTTNVEAQNPLRYPYAGTTNTILTIFPSGSRATTAHKHKHYGSYITLNPKFAAQAAGYNKSGGGIRVQSIKTTESSGGDYTLVTYKYTDAGNISTGTTAYEPGGYAGLLFTSLSSNLGTPFTDFKTKYNAYFSNYLGSLPTMMGMNREITGPSVLYNFVTIKPSGNGTPATAYQVVFYQTYNASLLQRIDVNPITVSGKNSTRTLRIKDFTARVGNVLSVKTYDKTDKFVSERIYKYDDGTNIPLNQGILEQVSHDHRIFHKGTSNESHLAMVTVKATYPSVLLSTYSNDFLNNTSDSTAYISFDFYSGASYEQVSNDAFNNFFKTRSIPAYTKYSGMGPNVVTASNKNLINIQAASYTFKVSSSNFNTHIDTMACSIGTLANSWNKRSLNGGIYYTDVTDGSVSIWRHNETWVWNSPKLNTDGSYKNFRDFVYGAGSQATGWQTQGNVSRYTANSKLIESKNINGNYSATKLGYDESVPLARSVKSKFTEFTFSGAEDLNTLTDLTYFGGEVNIGTGVQSASFAHTGKYSLNVAQNNTGFIYRALIDTNNIERGKNYRGNVWIYDNGNTNAGMYYKFTNTSGTQLSGTTTTRITLTGNTNVIKCGSWKLLTLDILVPGSIAQGNLLEIGCDNLSATTAYFDDMRFYVKDFPITSYVYDPYTKLMTYELDRDNLYLRNSYDNAGMLIGTFKETLLGERQLTAESYNYPH